MKVERPLTAGQAQVYTAWQLPPLASLLARYREGPRRNKVAPLYADMLAEAERLAAPRTLWAEFAREAAAGLAPWLSPEAQAVVVALCTLGPAIDERLAYLTATKMAAAVVLDEIAAACVRQMAGALHDFCRKRAEREGLRAGPAFRPGLGRWPLAAQKVVFDLLPAAQIGMTINHVYMMAPLKSTSLIVPLYPARQ